MNRRIDIPHPRHRVRVRFERAFDHRDDAAWAAREQQVGRVAGAPADSFACQKLEVAVEQDRVRLGFRVDIDADG
jgi:hypothetical protein